VATNRTLEMLVGAAYPKTMRHLQQLIMDSEACAKAYGRKSLFGKDKFEPAFDAFMATLGRCVVSLAQDGHVQDVHDSESGVDALHSAMLRCEQVYGNWSLGFQFWRDYYGQFKLKATLNKSTFFAAQWLGQAQRLNLRDCGAAIPI
jgi:hypothetical protein